MEYSSCVSYVKPSIKLTIVSIISIAVSQRRAVLGTLWLRAQAIGLVSNFNSIRNMVQGAVKLSDDTINLINC